MNSHRLKLVAASVGAGAVVAAGALTMTLSEDGSAATVVSNPEMTLGETSTVEKAATEVETSVAAPEVTAEVPEGFGQ